MRVTVLSENTTRGPLVTPEFGLSLYIECNGQSILFDSGSSGNFAQNAHTLGIDLSRVDIAVLSHGHYDHANGFKTFLKLNDHAPIYAHEGFDGNYYKDPDIYIGIAPELKGNSRFVAVSGRQTIGDGLTLLSYDAATAPHPIAAGDLLMEGKGAPQPDDFAHEHYLLACEGDTRLLVTGCAHKGITNIMSWTGPEQVTHVVGGFHLVNVQPENDELFEALAADLLSYPVEYFTGHCTGIEQYASLKTRMGDRIHYLGTGQSLTI